MPHHGGVTEKRGVLVLAVSSDPLPGVPPGDGLLGTFGADSIVRNLLGHMSSDDWLDVHGPDAWELDYALADAGVVLRREERYETAHGFRAGSNHIVRYYGAVSRS